jgi:hypothetical protein
MPLPKVKDPAILELETIVTTRLAIPCSFMFGNMKENNVGVDTLDPVNDFPVFVLLSAGKGNKQSVNEAGMIQRSFEVAGFFLNRSDEATISSLKTEELNPLLNQMRQLGENLMYWINKSTLSINGGVDEWDANEVYSQHDASLYGYAFTFKWTVNTGTSGYYNSPS